MRVRFAWNEVPAPLPSATTFSIIPRAAHITTE